MVTSIGFRPAGLGRLALATLALLLAVQASAVAAPEWRSLTSGVGWGPCSTVTFTPNIGTQPSGADLRADLTKAARLINRAATREVVAIAPGTTSARSDGSDQINSAYFDDLGVRAAPGQIVVSGYASTTWGSERILDADIVMDDNYYAQAPEGLRVNTLAHEIGHALGLHHVADAHEVMSYGFVDDGDGVGPGTARALQTLYTGPCDSAPRLTGSTAWDLPDHGSSPPSARLRDLTAGSSTLEGIGAALTGTLHGLLGGGGASHAVVCREDAFPDCLAGSALAGASAPLVFVPGGPGGRIAGDSPVVRRLRETVGRGGTVYVLGGPNAVSEEILATLRSTWPDTRRVAGASRMETAAAVAREVGARFGRKGAAMLARNDNPADAVTGGAYAAAVGIPVLLTDGGRTPAGDDLHRATAAALADLGVNRTYVLGGPAAVSDIPVAALEARGHGPVRIAGRTRSETAVAIATRLWKRTEITADTAFVGIPGWEQQTWALALGAAPVAAKRRAPILLTGRDDVPYAPPAGGYPGDTGYYLSHLRQGAGVTGAVVDMLYVGSGPWSDRHAPASLARYVGLR